MQVMVPDLFGGRNAIHAELVAAHLLSQGCPPLLFILPAGEGNFFISPAVTPSHGMVFSDPAFVLHGSEDLRIPGGKALYQIIIHLPVGIKTAYGVQIAVKVPGPVDGGKLIFQRHGRKLILHGLIAGIGRHFPGVKGDGEIIQMHEAAGGQVGMLDLSVGDLQADGHFKRYKGHIRNLFNIQCKAVPFPGHVAVGLEAGLLPFLSAVLPGLQLFLKPADLGILPLVIKVNDPDGPAGKVEPGSHGMQLCSGVSAVGGAVPALQLIAEHQKPGQGMQPGLHGSPAFVFILVKGYRKLEQTVVEQDGCQGIHMHGLQSGRAQYVYKLPAESGGAEKGMIHVVAEAVRLFRLVPQYIQKALCRKTVGFSHL